MVYRGLYHFSVAYDKGKATDQLSISQRLKIKI